MIRTNPTEMDRVRTVPAISDASSRGIVRCGDSATAGSTQLPSYKRRRLNNESSKRYSSPPIKNHYDSDDGESDDEEECYNYMNRAAVTPSPEPPYKRVRFAATVSYSKVPSHTIPSDPRGRRMLWYSRDERCHIIEENRDIVHDFELDHEDHVKHYEEVFHRCLESPNETTSNYLEKVTVSIPAIVRGLEWGTCFIMKDYRKKHSEEVLRVQRQLPRSMNLQMQTRIISSQAMKSSRPSRVMARLIGEGDSR